jgi:hypothetical protein
MIDLIISDPTISQNDIADHFGMSASWISTIMCSDLFQSRLAECREKLIDPQIRASLKVQFEGMLARSMEVLREKMKARPDLIPDQLAVQVMKVTSQSLGYGVREARVSVQETHVHLEELGNNLVSLLRRRKSEIYDHEASSDQDQHQGHPQQLQSGTAPRAGPPQQARPLGLPPAHQRLQAGDAREGGLVHPVHRGAEPAPSDRFVGDPPAPEVR